MNKEHIDSEIGLALSDLGEAIKSLSFGIIFGHSPGALRATTAHLHKALTHVDTALQFTESKTKKKTKAP